MKKLTQLLPVFILALGLMGFFSCKKSSTTTTTPATTATGKSFYCKLDGTEYAPAGGGRYYISGSGPGIQIVGDDATITAELFVVNTTVGTYAVGTTGSNNHASIEYNTSGKKYESTSGEIKITKSDGTKMSGTFHFSATGPTGTMEVTVGEFNDIPKN